MPFDLPAFHRALAGTQFAGHVTHLPTASSTNTLALEAAQAGARHGVWIADQQTAGRGRGAHTWHSPAGQDGEPAGLYLTALAAPPVPLQSTLRLSFASAIAAQAAIAHTTGLLSPTQIDIRWPNDLVLPQPAGPSRKVGGILIETSAQPAPPSGPARLRYVVIGIGINLNQLHFPPELDPIATSLRRQLPGHPIVPREPLALALLRNLDTALRRLAADPGLDPPDLATHSTWLSGKHVRVEPRPGDSTLQPGYTGITAGLDPQGFLRVQADDGQLRTVLSGGLRELP